MGSDPRRTRRLLILSASNTVGGGEEPVAAAAGFPEASRRAAPWLPGSTGFRGCSAAGTAPRLLVRPKTTPGLMAVEPVDAERATRTRMASARVGALILSSLLSLSLCHSRADRLLPSWRTGFKVGGGRRSLDHICCSRTAHCVSLFL
jgi:hypothetical protein